MRVLTFTNLYPNSAQPRHGIFVEQRLRRLIASGAVTAHVVAPIAWFPFQRGPFRRFAAGARVARMEERHGVRVSHPRFPVIPALTVWINPLLMALGALPTITRLRREQGDFDLIDAQFVYPDGVAGTLLGHWLNKPVVITARGSDVNLVGRTPVAGAWIRWASRHCAAFIAVSQALKQAMTELGIPASQITVLRNGVDLDLFRPHDREQCRTELGLAGPVLLSVGNLVQEKGHELVIEALVHLRDYRLVLIGSGPREQALRALARDRQVLDRILWIDHVPQDVLPRYYSAADVTVLASVREGMPNVLLESLACGTPVVASRVGGNAEVVAAPEAGVLMAARTPDALIAAVRALTAARPTRESTRAYAQRFSWDETIAAQARLFEAIAAGTCAPATLPSR